MSISKVISVTPISPLNDRFADLGDQLLTKKEKI